MALVAIADRPDAARTANARRRATRPAARYSTALRRSRRHVRLHRRSSSAHGLALLAVWRSPETTRLRTQNTTLPAPATTGVTVSALTDGPTWRIDHANMLIVDIDSGTLQSTTRLQLLGGDNLAAIERTPDHWEIIQFETATLIGAGRYALSNLLRGQRGTEVTPGTTILRRCALRASRWRGPPHCHLHRRNRTTVQLEGRSCLARYR